jgi:hypothetical protein
MRPICLSSTILLKSLTKEDAMKPLATLPMLFGLMLAVSTPAMARTAHGDDDEHDL